MPRRTVRTVKLAAALAAVVTTGSLAPTLYADWAGRSAIDHLLARTHGLSVGAVDVDAWTGKLVLRRVAYAEGSLHVYARSLTVPIPQASGLIATAAAADKHQRLAQWPSPAKSAPEPSATDGPIHLKVPGAQPPVASPAQAPSPSAGSGATAGIASASDVTIVHGATTYTIKRIDVAGTTLTNADLAALLDPHSPDTLAARLQKISADSITIPEIVTDNKTPGSEVHGTLSGVALTKVAQGRIGTASIASSTYTGTGANQGDMAKTGAVVASGLDLALLDRMINTTRADESEPLKPLADAVTINDILVTNHEKKTAIAIASIAEKGLKARPLRSDLATLSKATDGKALIDKTDDGERSKAAFDDIASSFDIGTFAMDRVDVTDSGEKGPSKLSVGSMGFEDYHARHLAAFRIRDLGFDQPSVKFGFATLDLANVLVPVLAKAGGGQGNGLPNEGIPSIAKVDVSQIRVDAQTPQDDGSSSTVKFKLAHLGSASDQSFDHLPTQGMLTVDNLTFDIPPSEGAGAKELIAMGYKHLDISGAIATTYDKKQETLSVQKFLLSGVGMGELNLALDLVNVGKGILSSNPAVAKASALAMLLKRVDLKINNSGLVEKLLAYKAEQDGKKVEEERDAAIDLFSVTLPESLGNGPGIKAVGTALAKFIAEPRTLHINAASKDGIGASDLGLISSPDELLSRVDIKAEADQ